MTVERLTPRQPRETDEQWQERQAAYRQAVRQSEIALLKVRRKLDAITGSQR